MKVRWPEAGIHPAWFYNKLTVSNKYHRLCAENRKVIGNMKQAGKTQTEIAQAIGCSQSAISKSLALRNLKFSHETIYRHIADDKKAGDALALNLRINGRRCYRRRSKIGRGEKIPNRVDIEERPAVVSGRKRSGDWEADLIPGAAGSGFLLSVYERKSRIGRLHLLPDKGSAETTKGIVTILFGLKVSSITYDNGLEFAMHELVNELLECESYFCKPYRSWEKGGIVYP